MSPEQELLELEREEKELKVAMLRLGLQAEANEKSRRLQNFIPSPKQLDFFKNASKHGRALYAGNRFGKSTLGVVEDCCWLIGYRPFFPEGHPLRTLGIPTAGVKGLVIAEDWDKVDEIFTNRESSEAPGKFFEFLPESFIKNVSKGQGGVINGITVESVVDGVLRLSSVKFDTVRSFVLNPKSFESSDYDFIHLDEPVPRELWVASSRGLIDRAGKYWWLLTPLSHPWMYDEQVAKSKMNPVDYWYTEASMDDNPTLTTEAKERYINELPMEERECRRLGKPLAHGRRVYGHYDENVHCWKPEWGLPDGWVTADGDPSQTLWIPPWINYSGFALDPHPQTPHAVLFTTIAPDGTFYIYDELFAKLDIDKLAEVIIALKSRVRTEFQLCDKFAWNENQMTGQCWAYLLAERGLDLVEASKEKTQGIIRAQQIWNPRNKHKVWVMPRCRNFKREISQYVFDKENKPVDKDDHMMECLYRIVLHTDLRYVPPVPKHFEPIQPSNQFYNPSLDFPDMWGAGQLSL